MSASGQPPGAEAIRAWLVTAVAAEIGLDATAIDVALPLASYGLSSRQAVGLTGDLEAWLGRRLPPTLVFEYPSIAALADYLGDGAGVEGAETPAAERPSTGRIAILGMSCRLPGADGMAAFWRLLRNGEDAIVEVPAERWTVAQWYDREPGRPGRMNTRWGGFLSAIDAFDPGFFDLSPREAASMDPQQRLLLEVAWEALERAALVPERLAGSRTGVFVGLSTHDYAQLLLRQPASMDAYAGTGGASSIAANRLSYWLDLRGPSLTVDTACSSSLVAVHLACQSLLRGECDLALAGGANLILSPDLTIAFSQAQMMAGGGRCRTFDASAEGYVRSEGCGVVVLKRLEDAEADGDEVLAVVLGSAVNQDGRSNGMTAPNARAQQAVIREALRCSGLEPARIGYVEAHGTGTPLGDPIEVAALKAVLTEGREDGRRCAIGSVKTNIGHTEAAAGIAGLLKAVLVLREGQVPPNVHLDQINPLLELDGTPFFVPVALTPWPNADADRFAGVSSFGFGGTNCHVVLAGPPPGAPRVPVAGRSAERTQHLLVLSAKAEPALRDLARRYADYLGGPEGASLPDVCFSAATGRAHFPFRLAVHGATSVALAQKLARFADSPAAAEVTSGRSGLPPKVAFIFTGQDSYYAGMGRELLETQPSFRRTMEECRALLGSHGVPDSGANTQTALFALGYSLARLWQSWGVEPSAVLGNGLGEYVAACVTGVFSLEHGLRLVAERARLDPILDDAERVASGVTTLYEQGYRIFVEIGASPVLSALAVRCLSADDTHVVPSLRGEGLDWDTLIEGLGRLHVLGVPVAWSGFDRDYDRTRVPLPGYPFQRQRCWLAVPSQTDGRDGHQTWETRIDRRSLGWLAQYRVGGDEVMPLAAHMELILAAAHEILGASRPCLEDLELHRPLLIPPADGAILVRVGLAPPDARGRRAILFHSKVAHTLPSAGEWLLHATGSLM